MSNYLAVANVTAALDELLSKTVNSIVSGATVSTLRPDKLQEGATGVNVFLYQVTPNTSWRNVDLPTRGSDGQLVQRPLIALDLHYLLSFYGDATKLEPERLLGGVMSAMQTQPQLNRAVIQAAKNNGTRNDNGALLPSDLDQQIELVKFTLLPLNLEELSKLWSVFFQVAYRLSVAYVGTVVLLESAITPQAVLPVREPNIGASPDERPLLEKIFSQVNDPLLKDLMVGNQAIIVGGDLIIQGQRLLGPETVVRFDETELHTNDPNLQWELSDTQILLRALPATPPPHALRAGSRCIQLVHKSNTPQQPTDPPQRILAVSNGVAFLVRPLITKDKLEVNNARELVLPVTPKVGPEQNVVLYLNEKAGGNAPPRSYTIPEPQNKRRSRMNDTDVLTLPLDKVERGTYLVRLEVAGVTSPLRVEEGTGAYVGPMVVVEQATLQVTVRKLIPPAQQGTPATVRAEVEVKDKNGALVSGLQVTAQWLTPDEPTARPRNLQTQTTSADGVARFEISDGRSANVPYVFEVKEVKRNGNSENFSGHLREELLLPEANPSTVEVAYILLDFVKENDEIKETRAYVCLVNKQTQAMIPGAQVKATWTFSTGAPETQEEFVSSMLRPTLSSEVLPGEAVFKTTRSSQVFTFNIDEVVGHELDSVLRSKSINRSSKAARIIAVKPPYFHEHLKRDNPSQKISGLVYPISTVELRGFQSAMFPDQRVDARADWYEAEGTAHYPVRDDELQENNLKFHVPQEYNLDESSPNVPPVAFRGTYILAVRYIGFPELPEYYFSRSESFSNENALWLTAPDIPRVFLEIPEDEGNNRGGITIETDAQGVPRVRVLVHEDNGAIVSAVNVEVVWEVPTIPNATFVKAASNTNEFGYAFFDLPPGPLGTYRLTVQKLSLIGFEYEKNERGIFLDKTTPDRNG